MSYFKSHVDVLVPLYMLNDNADGRVKLKRLKFYVGVRLAQAKPDLGEMDYCWV